MEEVEEVVVVVLSCSAGSCCVQEEVEVVGEVLRVHSIARVDSSTYYIARRL